MYDSLASFMAIFLKIILMGHLIIIPMKSYVHSRLGSVNINRKYIYIKIKKVSSNVSPPIRTESERGVQSKTVVVGLWVESIFP